MTVILSKSERAYLARNFADLGKAIITVGLAGFFFADYPFMLRLSLTIAGPMFLIVGFFIQPSKKGGKQ